MNSVNITSSLSVSRQIQQDLKKKYDADVSRCYQCGKCSAGCPVAFAMDNPPHKIIQMVKLGLYHELIQSRSIWLCATCHTCSARCPRDVNPSRVMEGLRIEARNNSSITVSELDIFHTRFIALVERYGRVHELALMLSYNVLTKKLLKDAQFGPELLMKKKLSLKPHTSETIRNDVQKIFSRCRDYNAGKPIGSSLAEHIPTPEPTPAPESEFTMPPALGNPAASYPEYAAAMPNYTTPPPAQPAPSQPTATSTASSQMPNFTTTSVSPTPSAPSAPSTASTASAPSFESHEIPSAATAASSMPSFISMSPTPPPASQTPPSPSQMPNFISMSPTAPPPSQADPYGASQMPNFISMPPTAPPPAPRTPPISPAATTSPTSPTSPTPQAPALDLSSISQPAKKTITRITKWFFESDTADSNNPPSSQPSQPSSAAAPSTPPPTSYNSPPPASYNSPPPASYNSPPPTSQTPPPTDTPPANVINQYAKRFSKWFFEDQKPGGDNT